MNYPENTAMQICRDSCRRLVVIKVTDLTSKKNHIWSIKSSLGKSIPFPINPNRLQRNQKFA